jgi:hypothetical protein
MPSVERLADFRESFLSDDSGTRSFQGVDQRRYRHLGRIFDQQMDMVVLPVTFLQGGLKIGADLGKALPKALEDPRSHGLPPILEDEDQMDMEAKYAVSPSSIGLLL